MRIDSPWLLLCINRHGTSSRHNNNLRPRTPFIQWFANGFSLLQGYLTIGNNNSPCRRNGYLHCRPLSKGSTVRLQVQPFNKPKGPLPRSGVLIRSQFKRLHLISPPSRDSETRNATQASTFPPAHSQLHLSPQGSRKQAVQYCTSWDWAGSEGSRDIKPHPRPCPFASKKSHNIQPATFASIFPITKSHALRCPRVSTCTCVCISPI
ncbi:hypothetical protein BKA61DRAFT_44167 [Leptodontidium sp. MPI-SDFR-AT-0119]|nr:hypothetical protein BKA61DRAFT_44167 [Leptodontidium sp. MPI-SDFR-AT-0119]